MIISVNDGLTPYVGDNGYWFIGDEDTGVRANGQSTTTIETVVLTATGWSNLSQTVGCAGILADETRQLLTIFPDNESRDAYMLASVVCTENGANSLTFTAETTPTEDLTVYVAIEEAGQAPLDVYATNEHVVGTWIDGKPIYRQVIVTTAPTVVTNGTYVFSTIPLGCSVDYVFPATGTILQPSTQVYPIPYISNSGDGQVKTYIDKSINSVRFGTNLTGFNGCQATLFAEYTKTTDSATIPTASAVSLMNAYDEGVNEA